MISVVDDQTISDQAIRAIAFFDLFDFPLTVLEVKREVGGQISFRDLRRLLLNDKRLGEKRGFFFLAGQEQLVVTRQKRNNYAYRKQKIARRFARVFSCLPWVRCVALANVIGYNNLRDSSDIDLFIITSPGRLWLSRLYCTGLAKLLRMRPTYQTKRDRLCLSFYISSDQLDIRSLYLEGGDPYFEKWQKNLILLYNKKETYEDFLVANSGGQYAQNELVSYQPSFLERLARTWQLYIMPPDLKQAANNSDGVVINNFVLKFHQSDRRRELINSYEKKIKEIG